MESSAMQHREGHYKQPADKELLALFNLDKIVSKAPFAIALNEVVATSRQNAETMFMCTVCKHILQAPIMECNKCNKGVCQKCNDTENGKKLPEQKYCYGCKEMGATFREFNKILGNQIS